MKTATRSRPAFLKPHEFAALRENRLGMLIRPVTPQPVQPKPGAYLDAYNHSHEWWWWTKDNKLCNGDPSFKSPFGAVGDELWIKEAYYDRGDYSIIGKYVTDRYCYAADKKHGGWILHQAATMPRWASRYTLRVTSLAVKRIQDATEEDVKAWGVESHIDAGVTYYGPYMNGDARPEKELHRLSCELYGDDVCENWWMWFGGVELV